MTGTSARWASRFTEADLRLYPTIIRYDSVYATLFKCTRLRISDLPNLSRWRAELHNLTTASDSMQAAHWPLTLCCERSEAAYKYHTLYCIKPQCAPC